MATDSRLERGRAAYTRRAWDDAWRLLDEADRAAPLEPDDLELLGWSAALTARHASMLDAFERLHHRRLADAMPVRAARAAFWVGMRLFSVGEPARAAGWLARVQQLVEHEDCVERGYLLWPAVHRLLAAGDLEGAASTAACALEIGLRFEEPDLVAVARNLQGRAWVRLGRVSEGLARMDEAMVAATARELSPLVTGLVYCNVIACCQAVYAVDRSREWTAALSEWCRSQPQLVPFSGQCRVHRCELFQVAGQWTWALEEAASVADEVAPADRTALGAAYYQRAEVHRLRGERAAAEESYRAASRHGWEPQPGLALLRLAQGRVEAAWSALHRILDATTDPLERARFLPAAVEILLATGDLDAVRPLVDELERTAHLFGTELLEALAGRSRGATRLASGDAAGAAAALQSAFAASQRLEAPYLAARTRALLGRAYAALGDTDGAELEIEAARQALTALGARDDLDALAAHARTRPNAHGLTPRELEVLQHLARGETNKAIARALFVSDRTIDRHVSNLFAKLGVSTRTAATAWAWEHQLVPRG